MKIIPFDRITIPFHSGHRGWLGRNNNFKIVDSLEESDFVWFNAWGDGASLQADIEEAYDLDKTIIFNITGDWCYVPDNDDKNFYFVTNLNPNSTAFQIQVPYSYHDSIKWLKSDHSNDPKVRSNLACFRGSFGTNSNRRSLSSLNSSSIPIIECDGWLESQKGNFDIIKKHSDLLLSSKFTLCPPGYGPSSIRVVEAIMRSSIPVLIDDDARYFNDPMKFCVRWKFSNGLEGLKSLLEEMDKDEYYTRLALMAEFTNNYLLNDENSGCEGTIGYTNWIKKCVAQSRL